MEKLMNSGNSVRFLIPFNLFLKEFDIIQELMEIQLERMHQLISQQDQKSQMEEDTNKKLMLLFKTMHSLTKFDKWNKMLAGLKEMRIEDAWYPVPVLENSAEVLRLIKLDEIPKGHLMIEVAADQAFIGKNVSLKLQIENVSDKNITFEKIGSKESLLLNLRNLFKFEELDSLLFSLTVYKDGNKPLLTYGTPMRPFKLSQLASKTSQILNLEIKKKLLEPRAVCQCLSSSSRKD